MFFRLIHMSSIVENLIVIQSLICIHTSRYTSFRLVDFQINININIDINRFGVFAFVASIFASIRTISMSPSPGSGLHLFTKPVWVVRTKSRMFS